MKKVILPLAALVATAMTVNAQVEFNTEANLYVNHVKNGTFDAPGYVQAVPGGYTWDPWDKQMALSELPNWILNTGGEWNGGCNIETDEGGDGDYRPEDDTTFLHIWGYNDNGWTNINVAQVVEGLTVGREYQLQFLVGAQWPEGSSWTPEKDYGFTLSEVDYDKEGNPQAGKLMMTEKNMAEDTEMGPVAYTFTAPAEKVYLNFYLANKYYEGNKKDGLFMDIDCVSIFSEEEPDNSAVGTVGVDLEGETVIYDLQGRRVNSDINTLKGLYIMKSANGVKKVIR